VGIHSLSDDGFCRRELSLLVIVIIGTRDK
jgi:hypothetical protein